MFRRYFKEKIDFLKITDDWKLLRKKKKKNKGKVSSKVYKITECDCTVIADRKYHFEERNAFTNIV